MTEKRDKLYIETTKGNFTINMPVNIVTEPFKEDFLSTINFLTSTILDKENRTDFSQMRSGLQRVVLEQFKDINDDDDDVNFQKMIRIIKASIYNAVKNHMGTFEYMSESWLKMKKEYQDVLIMVESTLSHVSVMIGNLGVLIR